MSAQEQALFGTEHLDVPRSDMPTMIHVDHSALVQIVSRESNPRFHALLARFEARTGSPELVNNSFNVRGEQIVNTPEDAFSCFMAAKSRTWQLETACCPGNLRDRALKIDYKGSSELD